MHDAEEPKPEARKTKVFISYSRKDVAFVDELQVSLIGRGYNVVLDRTDIAPGEPFQERISGLILSADAVVFVLTDRSLASKICAWEVERTLELGKRIVPLTHGPRTFEVPAKLSALNWIFTDDPSFGETAPAVPSSSAVDKLQGALDVDIAWVREHSRLTSRAREWTRADGADRAAKLLRRGEVAQARAWMKLRPGHAAPKIPKELVDFIDASDIQECAERDRLLTITGRAFVLPAEQAFSEHRYDAALRLAAAGMLVGEDIDCRLVAERGAAAVRAAYEQSLRVVIDAHKGGVRSAVFDHVGAHILTAGDTSAKVWRADSGALILTIETQERLQEAKFTPDGARIVTLGERSANVWAAETGQHMYTLGGHEQPIWRVDAHGDRIVTASLDMTGRLRRMEDGETLSILAGHAREMRITRAGALMAEGVHVEFSRDGAYVLSAGGAFTRIWDREGALLKELKEEEGAVLTASFSGDGSHVVTSGMGVARVWNWRSEDQTQGIVLDGHWGTTEALAFDGAGKRVLVAGKNIARFWDVATGQVAVELEGMSGAIRAAQFSPDGTRLAMAAGNDAALWTPTGSTTPASPLRGHEGKVGAVAFDPSGRRMLSASADGTARIWDASAGRVLFHFYTNVEIAFSRDSRRMLVADSPRNPCVLDLEDGALLAEGDTKDLHYNGAFLAFDDRRIVAYGYFETRIIDAEAGTVLATLPGGDPSFSADGRFMVALSFEQRGDDFGELGRRAHLWDAVSFEHIGELPATRLESAQFSPIGERILTWGHDGASLWSVSPIKLLAELGKERMRSAKFSPDGSRIITGGKTAVLWDATSGRKLTELPQIDATFFSPDGATLVVSTRTAAWLWDASAARERASLPRDKEGALKAAFNTDSTRLATADGQVAKIWDVATGECLMVLRNGHDRPIRELEFSAEGVLILTASIDKTCIWDASTGRLLTALPDGSRRAFFSPDGARVVTSSGREARVWDVSRAKAVVGDLAAILVASLDNGRGRRTLSERSDILMQSVAEDDDDLHVALTRRLTMEGPSLRAHDASRRTEMLTKPAHRFCYTRPIMKADDADSGSVDDARQSRMTAQYGRSLKQHSQRIIKFEHEAAKREREADRSFREEEED